VTSTAPVSPLHTRRAGSQIITRYCISDAVQTAFLLLRWWLLKGEVSTEGYRTGARSLLAACEAHGGLADFVARVDRRVLLLENDTKGG
jgi:hypothetical protein